MLTETDAKELQMVRANLLAVQERLKDLDTAKRSCRFHRGDLDADAARNDAACRKAVARVKAVLADLERHERERGRLHAARADLERRLAAVERVAAELADQVRAELARLDRLGD